MFWQLNLNWVESRRVAFGSDFISHSNRILDCSLFHYSTFMLLVDFETHILICYISWHISLDVFYLILTTSLNRQDSRPGGQAGRFAGHQERPQWSSRTASWPSGEALVVKQDDLLTIRRGPSGQAGQLADHQGHSPSTGFLDLRWWIPVFFWLPLF